MTRIISLFISMSLLLCLAACQNYEDPYETTSKTPIPGGTGSSVSLPNSDFDDETSRGSMTNDHSESSGVSDASKGPVTIAPNAFKLETVAENIAITDAATFLTGADDEYISVSRTQNGQTLYAFMNNKGKIMGDGFVYSEITYGFDEQSGLAPVTYKDGTKAYINKKFKKVITAKDIDTKGIKYDDISLGFFSGGYAVVSVLIQNDWCDGIINTKGEKVVSFDSKNMYTYTNNGNGTFVRTSKDSKDAIVNSKGKVVYEFKEGEMLADMSNGFVLYQTEDKDGNLLMGLMDKNFKKITEPIYIYDPQLIIYNDFIYVKSADGSGGKFINANGEEVLRFAGITGAVVYDSAIVCSKSDKLYYIYDLSGRQLSGRGFDYVMKGVYNDHAVVMLDKDSNAIVDLYGNVIYQTKTSDEYILGGNNPNSPSGYFIIASNSGAKILKAVKN